MLSDREVLLLTGELKPGLTREAAAATLMKVLEVPPEQARVWLAGGEQVLRINVELGTAFRICEALRADGIGVRRHRMTYAEVADATGDVERAAEIRRGEQAAPWIARELAVMSPQHAPALAALAAKPRPPQPKRLPCPCCRNETLSRRGAGEECRRCGWQDYPEQGANDPDRVIKGRNYGLSLNAARRIHEHYGSIRPGDYVPNHVPLGRRLRNGAIAILVIAYCSFSLWVGAMILPGGPGNRLRPVRFEGVEVWLMATGLVAGVMYGVLSIVDHYDRRRNEHLYHRAGKISFVLMAVFTGLAVVVKTYSEDGGWLALAMGFMVLLIVYGAFTSVRSQNIEY